jgi:hypothetical protein
VEQVAWMRVFVADDGRGGMEIAPATEMSTAQDSTDGGGAESGALSDLVSGSVLTAKINGKSF